MQGCWEPAPHPFFTIMGEDGDRCPVAIGLFNPDTEALWGLYLDGYLRELGAIGLRRAPSVLEQGLRWCDEMHRDFKARQAAADRARER